MLEQALLRDQFDQLLRAQREAVAGYEALARRLADEDLREEARQLQREKLRHVQLTERLLELVD